MKKFCITAILILASTLARMSQTTEVVALEQTDQTPTLAKRFYSRSGLNTISLFTVGYSTVFLLPNHPQGYDITEFTGRQHFLNLSLFDFRIHYIGASLLDFEFGVNTPGSTKHGVYLPAVGRGGETPDKIEYAKVNSMWFAYKPSIKAYIPLAAWLAAEVYVGAQVDITSLWGKVLPTYYPDPVVPAQNWFSGGFGGVGLLFEGKMAIPIEIKCEYRQQSNGNMALMPQGFYLGAQFHEGWRLDKHGNLKN